MIVAQQGPISAFLESHGASALCPFRCALLPGNKAPHRLLRLFLRHLLDCLHLPLRIISPIGLLAFTGDGESIIALPPETTIKNVPRSSAILVEGAPAPDKFQIGQDVVLGVAVLVTHYVGKCNLAAPDSLLEQA